MKEAHFPGDPRFSGWISPSSEDTSALSTNAWLSTLLLDCILQRSVPPQEVISTNASHIGSLGTYEYFNSCNDLINDNPELVEDETTKGRKLARSRNVARIRQQMKACFGSARTLNRLLIPIVLEIIFVLCLDCSISTPEFVNDMTFYDSLSFGLEVVHKEPKKERRHSSDSDVSAAVLVLTTLQAEADRPARVGKLLLANNRQSAGEDRERTENHNNDDDDDDDDDKVELVDDDDDEYVTCDSSDESSVQSDGKEKHDHSVGTSTLTAEEQVEGKQGSSVATKSQDYVLYDILGDANIDCFSTLEEVEPFIEKYEVRSKSFKSATFH
ncbi:hypothetical protein MHU86_6735 [Fragilaria crotonensis]|nr:hypothetical protein MHU86_6735 [Fragilaria crotonensis]